LAAVGFCCAGWAAAFRLPTTIIEYNNSISKEEHKKTYCEN
jgi:hypothetical protein